MGLVGGRVRRWFVRVAPRAFVRALGGCAQGRGAEGLWRPGSGGLSSEDAARIKRTAYVSESSSADCCLACLVGGRFL